MHVDTWAVVVATALGPIVSVLISIWVQRRISDRIRKRWVFATIMGLRGATLNPEHVRALNLVQVEFHDKPKVLQTWRAFLDHLEIPYTDEAASFQWGIRHKELLTALLEQMGKVVGVANETFDIARGGYYPRGWGIRDQREDRINAAKDRLSSIFLSEEFAAFAKRLQDAEFRARLKVELGKEFSPTGENTNVPV